MHGAAVCCPGGVCTSTELLGLCGAGACLAVPPTPEGLARAGCPTCAVVLGTRAGSGRAGCSWAVVPPAHRVCQGSPGLSQCLWHSKGASAVSRGPRHGTGLSVSETFPLLCLTWKSQFPARCSAGQCLRCPWGCRFPPLGLSACTATVPWACITQNEGYSSTIHVRRKIGTQQSSDEMITPRI